MDNTEKLAVYNQVTGKTDKSVRVTASNPVSVFAFTGLSDHLNDATNVFPVTAFGTEYYAISYSSCSPTIFDAYAVVATQNDTKIYHDGIEQITLAAGEVYYKTTLVLGDMTGAHITATHPVAFFAQCQRAIIPITNFGIGNVLFQQLAPAHTWGTRFFVPVSIIQIEYVRIVVSKSNTNITQTGGTIKTEAGGQPLLTNLQAGEFVELVITQGNKGCYIEANNPIGVCSFMRDDTGPYTIGAASQVWIPAIKQSTPNVLTAPFEYPIMYDSYYALVVTPTATKNNTKVSIGGAPAVSLSGGEWHDHSAMKTSMSYYNFPLTDHTAYYIFSNPAGIIVLGYGVLTVPGPGGASHYYLAGSGMRNLSAAFTANNIPYTELSEHIFCEHDITFFPLWRGYTLLREA